MGQNPSTGSRLKHTLKPWREEAYGSWPLPAATIPDRQGKEVCEEQDLSDLVFHGLAGFIDPLRPEAVESVKRCRDAGIRVLMITGDHPSTASAIAGELGLAQWGEPVVSGRHLSEAGAVDSPAFEKLVVSSRVFARASPVQKLEIVDVLIRRGEFVAVTGDGVNDAPALRRANIGGPWAREPMWPRKWG
jgi:magnesium-transporting ATPase (P-type)